MKLTARILLTLPFLIATFLYFKLNLSDNGCSRLIELIYAIGLWIFLVISFLLSIVAIVLKSQSEKLKAEPYSLVIAIVTLLTLIVAIIWGDNLKGEKWIEAKSQNYNAQPSAQTLILRKNGTFKVYLREDDFTYYYSGSYKKFGDTVSFENSIIEQTNSKMTVQYLLKDKFLLPLKKETNEQNTPVRFDVISIR